MKKKDRIIKIYIKTVVEKDDTKVSVFTNDVSKDEFNKILANVLKSMNPEEFEAENTKNKVKKTKLGKSK